MTETFKQNKALQPLNLFWSFGYSNFEFVSNFVLRILNFVKFIHSISSEPHLLPLICGTKR